MLPGGKAPSGVPREGRSPSPAHLDVDFAQPLGYRFAEGDGHPLLVLGLVLPGNAFPALVLGLAGESGLAKLRIQGRAHKALRT